MTGICSDSNTETSPTLFAFMKNSCRIKETIDRILEKNIEF